VDIVSITAEHLDMAAALLRARHQRDRTRIPDRSPGYEDPAAARPILTDLLAVDGASVVVALRDDRVVAYLLGAPVFRAPTAVFACFRPPRSVDIPHEGHAADPADAAVLYPRLYAARAQEWVCQGLVGHFIPIPANRMPPSPGRIWASAGRWR
jgi:hypothetical protein